MRGIVRPCRHHLGPDLHARWQAHLCGLCLTLRDVAGQAERALTGYDVLLLSVLVEAQAGSVPMTKAGPCALRGGTPATVVRSDTGAARLAAAGALLSAGAGIADKVGDGDLPRVAQPLSRRLADRVTRRGRVLAERLGLDPTPVLAAPARAAEAEAQAAPRLERLLAPTGEAVAALFAHTAVVASRPENGPALTAAGDAFGRLVHLLDAVEDHATDADQGKFNPLAATGTCAADARALAERLAAQVLLELEQADLPDRALVDVLLGKELRAAVHRVLPPVTPPVTAVPEQRRGGTGAFAATLAALTLLVPAVFIGGSSGSCGGGGPRRGHGFGGYPVGGGGYPPRGYDVYGYPPPRRRGYPPPQQAYGYRTVGPSCGQLLACNCCANLACKACCCGSSCSQ